MTLRQTTDIAGNAPDWTRVAGMKPGEILMGNEIVNNTPYKYEYNNRTTSDLQNCNGSSRCFQ